MSQYTQPAPAETARRTLSLRARPDGPHQVVPRQLEPSEDQALQGLVLGRPASAAPRQMGFAIPGASAITPRNDDILALEGEGHSVVVGPTGSGKSSGVLIPTLLSYRGGAVVIDIKGELTAATADYRRRFGPVHVIDPFGVAPGHASAGLNPLDLCDLGACGDAFDFATEIAALIGPARHQLSDPYWFDAARTLISRFITLLTSHLPACPARSIAVVRRLIGLTGGDLGTLLAYAWMSRGGDGEMDALVRSYDLAPQTLSCIISTADSLLAPLSGPAANTSLSRTTIPLRPLLQGQPVTVYLVLPAERLHSHAGLLRVWCGVLLQSMFRRRTRPTQDTLILIDEAAQVGRLDVVPALFSFGRGLGLRTTTIFQDLDQLVALYPDHYRTILQNAAAILQLSLPPAEAHDRLTALLGRPLVGRSPISTVHLVNQRRALGVTVPLHFADPRFAGLASAQRQNGANPARPASLDRELAQFDRSRALSPPGEPGIPEARGWHSALRRELHRFAETGNGPAARCSPETSFRALLGRLIGPEMLRPMTTGAQQG